MSENDIKKDKNKQGGKAGGLKAFAKFDFSGGLKSALKKIKIEYVLIAVAAIAVIALFASNFSPDTKKSSSESVSAEEYVSMLENKLSAQLSKIEGAGKVSVIVSVKRGITNELATKADSSSGGGSPVTVNGKPVILGEIYPEVCGVVVVAQGGNKLKVKMALLNATMVFLDVEADKIEILAMK